MSESFDEFHKRECPFFKAGVREAIDGPCSGDYPWSQSGGTLRGLSLAAQATFEGRTCREVYTAEPPLPVSPGVTLPAVVAPPPSYSLPDASGTGADPRPLCHACAEYADQCACKGAEPSGPFHNPGENGHSPDAGTHLTCSNALPRLREAEGGEGEDR